MVNSNEIVLQKPLAGEFDDPFSDLPPLDLFEIKKEEIATQLAALMVFSGGTRSYVSEKLHWKKSRLTQVLSGNANPTAKTIYEFSKSLGYDFDLIFRKFEQNRPRQPWESSQEVLSTVVHKAIEPSSVVTVVIKSLREVSEEIASGNGQDYYISSIKTNHDPAPLIIDIDTQKTLISQNDSWIFSMNPAIAAGSNFYCQQKIYSHDYE